MPIKLLSLLLCLVSGIAVAETLTLTGATVYPAPDDAPIENAAVVINDGKILQVSAAGVAELPADAVTIDLSGKHVTAGFWNNHVHYLVDEATSQDFPALQKFVTDSFLRWGFTTTVDTGSDIRITGQIQKAIENGDVNGPSIIKIGGSFVPPDGSPFYIAPVQLPELTDPDQATALASEFLALGVDGIKLFTGSWATEDRLLYLQADVIQAVTDTAHDRGALVFAHPSDSRGARLAVENGVDVLAHSFPAELDGPWDKALPADMVARGVSLVPTLKLFRVDLERIGLPPPVVERLVQNAIDQTAAVFSLGGTILFGTDVGYMAETDTTEEFEYLAQAGMGYRDILRSLTTAPAQRFNRDSETARIAPGFDADIVVLDKDPASDLSAFSAISMTLKAGKVVYQH